MSQLDSAALEELGRRAEELASLGLGQGLGQGLGEAGASGRAMVPALERKFRLFASLLQATGDNLAALRRAESQHSFGGQGFGASDALPLNGYGPSSGMPSAGMFDSFGHYTQEDAVDSIWPRGRMAEARERRDTKSLQLTGDKGPARA